MAETVYLLLGSNLGDREKYLSRALTRLEEVEGLEIIAVSSVYVSEAVEMAAGSPSFLNQVIKADYDYTPRELLHTLQGIEADLGRTDKLLKQPRTIDIDILLFGDQVIESDVLTVPHAKMLKRGFALMPLLQIDPELEHPAKKKPISEFVTDAMRKSVVIFKDNVARNV